MASAGSNSEVDEVILFFEVILKIFAEPIHYRKLSDHLMLAYVDIKTFFHLYEDSRKFEFFRNQPTFFIIDQNGFVSLVEDGIIKAFTKCIKADSQHFLNLIYSVEVAHSYFSQSSNREKLKFFEDRPEFFCIRSNGFIELSTKSAANYQTLFHTKEVELLVFFKECLTLYGPMYFSWFFDHLQNSVYIDDITKDEPYVEVDLWKFFKKNSLHFIIVDIGFVDLSPALKSAIRTDVVSGTEDEVLGFFIAKLVSLGSALFSVLLKLLQDSSRITQHFFAKYSLSEIHKFFIKHSDVFIVRGKYISLIKTISLDGFIYFDDCSYPSEEKQEVVFFFLDCLKEQGPMHFIDLSAILEKSDIQNDFKSAFISSSVSVKLGFFKTNAEVFYVNNNCISLYSRSILSSIGKQAISSFVKKLLASSSENFWTLIKSLEASSQDFSNYFANFSPCDKFYFFKRFPRVFAMSSDGHVSCATEPAVSSYQETDVIKVLIKKVKSESSQCIHFEKLCQYGISYNEALKKFFKPYTISEKFKFFRDRPEYFCIQSNGYVSIPPDLSTRSLKDTLSETIAISSVLPLMNIASASVDVGSKANSTEHSLTAVSCHTSTVIHAENEKPIHLDSNVELNNQNSHLNGCATLDLNIKNDKDLRFNVGTKEQCDGHNMLLNMQEVDVSEVSQKHWKSSPKNNTPDISGGLIKDTLMSVTKSSVPTNSSVEPIPNTDGVQSDADEPLSAADGPLSAADGLPSNADEVPSNIDDLPSFEDIEELPLNVTHLQSDADEQLSNTSESLSNADASLSNAREPTPNADEQSSSNNELSSNNNEPSSNNNNGSPSNIEEPFSNVADLSDVADSQFDADDLTSDNHKSASNADEMSLNVDDLPEFEDIEELPLNVDHLQSDGELLSNTSGPTPNTDEQASNNDELSSNNNEAPSNNKAPSNNNEAPSNIEEPFSNAKDLSDVADDLPSNNHTSTLNTDETISNIEDLPSDADDLQSNAGEPPSIEEPSLNTDKAQSHSDELPSNTSELSSNANETPSKAEASSNAREFLGDAEVLSSNIDKSLSNGETLPSNDNSQTDAAKQPSNTEKSQPSVALLSDTEELLNADDSPSDETLECSHDERVIQILTGILNAYKRLHYEKLCYYNGCCVSEVANYFLSYSNVEKYEFFKRHPQYFSVGIDDYVSISNSTENDNYVSVLSSDNLRIHENATRESASDFSLMRNLTKEEGSNLFKTPSAKNCTTKKPSTQPKSSSTASSDTKDALNKDSLSSSHPASNIKKPDITKQSIKEDDVIEILKYYLNIHKRMHCLELCKNAKVYFASYSPSQKFSFFKDHPKQFCIDNDNYVTFPSAAAASYRCNISIQKLKALVSGNSPAISKRGRKRKTKDEVIKIFVDVLKNEKQVHYEKLCKTGNKTVATHFKYFEASAKFAFFKQKPKIFFIGSDGFVTLHQSVEQLEQLSVSSCSSVTSKSNASFRSSIGKTSMGLLKNKKIEKTNNFAVATSTLCGSKIGKVSISRESDSVLLGQKNLDVYQSFINNATSDIQVRDVIEIFRSHLRICGRMHYLELCTYVEKYSEKVRNFFVSQYTFEKLQFFQTHLNDFDINDQNHVSLPEFTKSFFNTTPIAKIPSISPKHPQLSEKEVISILIDVLKVFQPVHFLKLCKHNDTVERFFMFYTASEKYRFYSSRSEFFLIGTDSYVYLLESVSSHPNHKNDVNTTCNDLKSEVKNDADDEVSKVNDDKRSTIPPHAKLLHLQESDNLNGASVSCHRRASDMTRANPEMTKMEKIKSIPTISSRYMVECESADLSVSNIPGQEIKLTIDERNAESNASCDSIMGSQKSETDLALMPTTPKPILEHRKEIIRAMIDQLKVYERVHFLKFCEFCEENDDNIRNFFYFFSDTEKLDFLKSCYGYIWVDNENFVTVSSSVKKPSSGSSPFEVICRRDAEPENKKSRINEPQMVSSGVKKPSSGFSPFEVNSRRDAEPENKKSRNNKPQMNSADFVGKAEFIDKSQQHEPVFILDHQGKVIDALLAQLKTCTSIYFLKLCEFCEQSNDIVKNFFSFFSNMEKLEFLKSYPQYFTINSVNFVSISSAMKIFPSNSACEESSTNSSSDVHDLPTRHAQKLTGLGDEKCISFDKEKCLDGLQICAVREAAPKTESDKVEMVQQKEPDPTLDCNQGIINTFLDQLKNQKRVHFLKLCESCEEDDITVKNFFHFFSNAEKLEFFNVYPQYFSVDSDNFVTVFSALESSTNIAYKESSKGSGSSDICDKAGQQIQNIVSVDEGASYDRRCTTPHSKQSVEDNFQTNLSENNHCVPESTNSPSVNEKVIETDVNVRNLMHFFQLVLRDAGRKLSYEELFMELENSGRFANCTTLFEQSEKLKFFKDRPDIFVVHSERFISLGSEADSKSSQVYDSISKTFPDANKKQHSDDTVNNNELLPYDYHVLVIRYFIKVLQSKQPCHFKWLVKEVCTEHPSTKSFFIRFRASVDLLDFFKIHSMYFIVDDEEMVSLKGPNITPNEALCVDQELTDIKCSIISKAVEFYTTVLQSGNLMSAEELEEQLNLAPGYIFFFFDTNYHGSMILNFFRDHPNNFCIFDDCLVGINQFAVEKKGGISVDNTTKNIISPETASKNEEIGVQIENNKVPFKIPENIEIVSKTQRDCQLLSRTQGNNESPSNGHDTFIGVHSKVQEISEVAFKVQEDTTASLKEDSDALSLMSSSSLSYKSLRSAALHDCDPSPSDVNDHLQRKSLSEPISQDLIKKNPESDLSNVKNSYCSIDRNTLPHEASTAFSPAASCSSSEETSSKELHHGCAQLEDLPSNRCFKNEINLMEELFSEEHDSNTACGAEKRLINVKDQTDIGKSSLDLRCFNQCHDLRSSQHIKQDMVETYVSKVKTHLKQPAAESRLCGTVNPLMPVVSKTCAFLPEDLTVLKYSSSHITNFVDQHVLNNDMQNEPSNQQPGFLKELSVIAKTFNLELEMKCVNFFKDILQRKSPRAIHIKFLRYCASQSSDAIRTYLNQYIQRDLLIFFYLHLEYFLIDPSGYVGLQVKPNRQGCDTELEIIAANFFTPLILFVFKGKALCDILERCLYLASEEVQLYLKKTYPVDLKLFFINNSDHFHVDVFSYVSVKH